ncbi:NUDIX domain-containing protein [Phycicoccus sp. M110.8]|uniref:NUDIX hydrolase n=1 Tax=Phycicoccus sp. M110.8 TaxID=3075433 RepID=UPI0028FD32C4|nr:NUDIX domain-containing protein [Phycicoccus sp. M110.8]MDU0312903.1 NUDIX domain-containing protein [Phycicoccus sp. M110.8]HET8768028.1 NUDIX domain-containing protein [Pedococcus sp.]
MSAPHSVPIAVVAATGPGREVDRFALAHGADPVRELARRGWAVLHVESADLVGGVMELRYAVAAATPTTAGARAVPTDPGLVVGEDERPEPYQRTAAYGVVTSVRGVLLTELSERTAAPGRWTLPGGGLDPGESPLAALHREVWEESGQRVDAPELLEVTTSHWVGRAPSGRLEDFHAVRVVYAAWCPDPTDPVVHDVGGSTASVRWVAREEVGACALTGFATSLTRWLSG